MPSLNYFAIGAALGATIGPRAKVANSPSLFREMTREMAGVIAKRRARVEELHKPVNPTEQYVHLTRQAFLAVREEFSADRVVADPRLNRLFLKHCEAYGIEDSAFELNWTLLNMRKAGKLADLHSRSSAIRGQWQYSFASEIAARALFFNYGVSVDKLLCHPVLAREFDTIARRLAPGFSSFEYRWAGINLRKRGLGRTSAEKHVNLGNIEWSGRVKFGSQNRLPQAKGIYTLHEDGTALFAASTENIRFSASAQHRLIDVPFVQPSLWTPQPERMYWQFASMPDVTSNERHQLVNALVSRDLPVFNIPRHALVA